MTEFCEQYDYTASIIDHIRRKLKIGKLVLISGRNIITLSDDECDNILQYIKYQKENRKKKISTKYGHHQFECPRCGCVVKYLSKNCPNKNCNVILDWDLLMSHMPGRIKNNLKK